MYIQELPLTVNEAFSGILGSISIASWVFLLLPQLYENYSAKSAAGISLPFLLIWTAGDICNLIGALWAQLVPTVIALAVYFCFSDTTLVLQTLYYNLWVNRHGDPLRTSSTLSEGDTHQSGSAQRAAGQPPASEEPDEESPLLSRHYSNRSSDSNIGLPGSHMGRRKSSAGTLRKVVENTAASQRRSLLRAITINTLAILAVCAVGTAGWALAWRIHWWSPSPAPSAGGDQNVVNDKHTPLGAEILGYLSAVAYLGARIPQIYKNYSEKSCEGLSLLFFLLSLLGNLTYGAGILAHSLEPQYVVMNLPWLIGSLGTMVEDVAIFVQFHIYAKEEDEDEDSAII